ncbi:hypothetical protein LTS08_001701 [Lithohypha guttulata]|nr:hypothetical protein LTS08_001701 [Lithohypha guttulata]
MALQFERRNLYGGAITVDFPTDVIDTSGLREVPDHQEAFLRQSTLTSIIFEINQFQTPADVLSNNVEVSDLNGASDNTPSPRIPVADAAAANHHLKDTIPPEDRISDAGIETTAIKLSRASISNFPAYLSTATIIEPEIDRSAKSALPLSWQAQPVQKENETKTQQLLVRLGEYGTDLCVRINIPMKEFSGNQSEAALTELAVADNIMQKIMETLSVEDFSLFAGGE